MQLWLLKTFKVYLSGIIRILGEITTHIFKYNSNILQIMENFIYLAWTDNTLKAEKPNRKSHSHFFKNIWIRFIAWEY